MRITRDLSAAGIAVGLLALSTVGAAAQEGTTHSVAQDGGGDFDTIGAAIEAAADGDTIRIAPGTYVEHLVIEKDLTLSGEGDRSDVVVEPPQDFEQRQLEFEDEVGRFVIWVEDADVSLEHLTIGPLVGYAMAIIGGSAAIEDIATDDTIAVRGEASVSVKDSDVTFLQFGGPIEAVVTGNTLRDGALAFEGAQAVFEDNEVLDTPLVADGAGRIEVTGNTFRPNEDEPGVVIVDPESVGIIVDNEFEGGWVGILLEYSEDSLAEGNTIDGAEIGIVAVEGSSLVRGNSVADATETGIVVVGEGSTIEGNTVAGGRVGLHAQALPGEMHPRAIDHETGPFITDNTITGASHFGVIIEDAPAELSGNTICAGRESLKLEGEANLILGTNDICEPVDE
jgi:hypothetical protein